MAVDLSTIHINRALTSISIMLNSGPETYMYNQICARRPVDALSDNFFQYDRSAAARSDPAGQSNVRFLPSVTQAGAPAQVVDQAVSTNTYTCRRYALRDFVADKEILIADDPLSPLKDAGMILAQRVQNDAEFVVASIVAKNASYPAAGLNTLTTGANGTSWNKASAAGTGSEPLTDLRNARLYVEKSIQRQANVIALSAITKYHLADHNDLIGIMQYTDEGYLDGEGIHPEIRGLRIVTGRAVANTTKDGAAYSGDYLFGDQSEATASNQPCAIVCYVPEEKTIGPRGFSSFIWFDAPDETTRQRGISLRSYRDEARRGFYVEAAMTFDIQPGIVDSNSKITGALMIGRAAIP